MNIKKLILIGASTGGPGQIQKIIKSIDRDFGSTIVIAQHMQSSYLKSFAKQLNNNSKIDVVPTQDNMRLNPKTIYILDENYELREKNRELIFHKSEKLLNYSPNINLLFNSVAQLTNSIKMMCIVLTGIGDDGAKGAFELAKKNAICINENEESSIVFGMPKAANELNPSAPQLGIDEICEKIRTF